MTIKWQGVAMAAAMGAIAIALGCADNMAESNSSQLQQQQQQIEDLQHQIDALKQQQGQFYALSSQVAPGGCDHGVMHDATQRGNEKLAARDYDGALDYFQDAASACPNDATAEFNLGRAYEAEGERDQASAHYRRAAKLGIGTQADVGEQARAALSRIEAGR
ncbi:MAG TPA: tetratricopeptide repeat protein [Candidatus Binataceae bacterium]|nr:tetratricopeptide repeat protein [Candidatus Binataceae bacterium]